MAKILALKINNVTYPVYKASGAPVHSLSTVNDMFVVKNPDFPGGWEFYDERDFRKNYKFILDAPIPTNKFSAVVRVPDDE